MPRLIAETDARSVGDSHLSCHNVSKVALHVLRRFNLPYSLQ